MLIYNYYFKVEFFYKSLRFSPKFINIKQYFGQFCFYSFTLSIPLSALFIHIPHKFVVEMSVILGQGLISKSTSIHHKKH